MDDLFIYFIGLYLFASLSFTLYALERYHKAKNTDNLYDRAYAFRTRNYRINNSHIELSAPTKKDNNDYKSPLLDALSEFSTTFPNLNAMMRSTVTIYSFEPVWFHMDACLRYPFGAINAADIKLSDRLGGLLCSNIDSNSVIKNITYPRSITQLNIEIFGCEQLDSITLPRTNSVVELCFPDISHPIDHVHPTFCFHVPDELLHAYRQKYKNIPIRYSDGNTGHLRFYPIGSSPSDSAEVYPESKSTTKYLMTAASGMEVWVPEDKLDAWMAAQADQSPEAKARREKTAQLILQTIQRISEDSKRNSADTDESN